MTELGDTFGIPKVTGTHADVLAAVGLADVLAESTAGPVVVIENEAEYRVRLGHPLDESAVARIPQRPGYPYLKLGGASAPPAGAGDVVDYEAERERADRFREARSKRAPADAEQRELEQQDVLRGDWREIQMLRVLQGHETANKVYRAIVSVDGATFWKQLEQGLSAVASGQHSGLKWGATLVQIFNPNAPKGYARLKPDSTDRNDKTKERWTDPFVEWLKYRGYFRVAWGYFHGPRGEHVRLICPVPRHITVRNLEAVARALRRSRLGGGPPKHDALAVLRLAELLIRHSEDYHVGEEFFPGLLMGGNSPADVISGVMITNYQSLGQARAVTEMMTLELPGWFPIRNAHDAEAWLEVLNEHQRVLRALRDNRSDEIDLLLRYRRFLQARGESCTHELLDFLGRYGCFWMRAYGSPRDGGLRRPPRFTDSLVRRIVMENARGYSAILDDPGFNAVAAAVRRSTVSAQALKAVNRDHREIRYDLLHELRRNRNLPGPALVETVAEFVSVYNAENARIREVKKDLRAAPSNVTTEDFASFCRLVERYGPALVGALLCAFGSCREVRDEVVEDREEEPGSEAPSVES
ncbi:MAG: hypothetical protein QME70_00865 [Bacillota bacterium]|nr:hypothetical protein [Bacillota bacterium]